MSEDPLQHLRDVEEANQPSDAARSRMDAAFARHMNAVSSRAPRARSWRMPRVALGATVSIAAAIAVAIALSPSDPRSERYGFTAPDTAAARALVDAGEAAADAAWTPLGDDGYYHVFSTSFQLDQTKSPYELPPSTHEVWLRRDGSGRSIMASGGEYPERFMRIGYDGQGKIMNVGGSSLPKGRRVSPEQALRNPDEVFLMTYPRDGSPGMQYGWLRQPTKYVPTWAIPNSPTPNDDLSDAEWRLRSYWGITTNELDELPAGTGEQLDRAIERLLEDSYSFGPRGGEIATGAYGQSQDDIDREQMIGRATQLLGSAPLAPNARRSIFRWLALQPGAELKRDVRDRLGRTGDQVTFASRFDGEVRGRRISVQQLLDEAVEAGARDIGPETVVRMIDTSSKPVRKSTDRTALISLPKHSEHRTWRVELIIDSDSGELLQYSSSLRSRSTGTVPQLSWHPKGGLHLLISGGGGSAYGGGGAVYRVRERTSQIKPRTQICVTQPELCSRPRG